MTCQKPQKPRVRERDRERALDAPFPKSGGRPCAAAGCQASGLYPAPKSRDLLRDYLFFCLDHIRDYNHSWDYLLGLDAQEIEASRRAGELWERATWRLGTQGANGHPEGDLRLEKTLRAEALRAANFSGRRKTNPGVNNKQKKPPPAGTLGEAKLSRRAALFTLGLKPGVSCAEIKLRYRTLLKDLHPDLNCGKNRDPVRLQQVIEAWKLLRS